MREEAAGINLSAVAAHATATGGDAAAIAAGLDGLETKIEPPPPLEGDAYKSDAQSLPTSLREAANVFGSSSFARQAFGSEMVDHYVHFWLSESTAFESAVTDWERKRYFEQI